MTSTIGTAAGADRRDRERDRRGEQDQDELDGVHRAAMVRSAGA